MSVAENISAYFSNLEKLVNAKTVFGEAITVGETTIIPLVDISFGFGTGVGPSETQKNAPGGCGAGARLSASAIIVIQGEHVQVVQIKKATYLDNLIDKIPEVIEKLKAHKKNSQTKDTTVTEQSAMPAEAASETAKP